MSRTPLNSSYDGGPGGPPSAPYEDLIPICFKSKLLEIQHLLSLPQKGLAPSFKLASVHNTVRIFHSVSNANNQSYKYFCSYSMNIAPDFLLGVLRDTDNYKRW